MLRKLVQKILWEVSYSQVQSVLSNLREPTFDGLFDIEGDVDDTPNTSHQKRIVIPFKSLALERIAKMLEEADPDIKVDAEAGTVTKTIETRVGPRQRTERLGRVLNKNIKNIKKIFVDSLTEMGWNVKGDKLYPGSTAIEDFIIKAITTQYRHGGPYEVYGRTYANDEEVFEEYARREESTVDDFADFLLGAYRAEDAFGQSAGSATRRLRQNEAALELLNQTTAPILKSAIATAKVYQGLKRASKTYAEEAGGASIIISRAPVDVLRMSDFKNIQSCHSQGGSYFHCAVREAEGSGIVAWLVSNEELAKAGDLQGKDVFSDRERGIKGILPLARVRLRQFEHKHSGESLAIPEMRIYGNDREGFLAQVTAWAVQEQQEVIETIEKEGYGLSLDEFIRKGGSYSDTIAGKLFNNFFGAGRYADWDDTEFEGDGDRMEQVVEEVEGMIGELFLPNGTIDYDIDEDDYSISWDFSSDYEFHFRAPGPIEYDKFVSEDVEGRIDEIVNDVIPYSIDSPTVDVDWDEDDTDIVVNIYLNNSDGADDADEFHGQIAEAAEADNQINDTVEQDIQSFLDSVDIIHDEDEDEDDEDEDEDEEEDKD